MNILTPEDFPLLSQGPAIISTRGTIAMCASAELAAEITARINAGEMLRSMAAPEIVSGEPEPIPEGVYYADGNFYDMATRSGQGQEFMNKWARRRHEFPNQSAPLPQPPEQPGWSLGAVA